VLWIGNVMIVRMNSNKNPGSVVSSYVIGMGSLFKKEMIGSRDDKDVFR
jgi:hypothetical protein